jgi:hypothetical protein
VQPAAAAAVQPAAAAQPAATAQPPRRTQVPYRPPPTLQGSNGNSLFANNNPFTVLWTANP